MIRVLLYFTFWFSASIVLGQMYEVKSVSLNSVGSSNMCPVKFGDGFVYMSNEKAEYVRTVKDGTGNFPFNLHLASRDSMGEVNKTTVFAPEVATLFNDGPLSFFEKDSAFVFSRNQNIEKLTRKNESQKLGLFVSFCRNGEWSPPESLPFNDEDFNCTHPTISSDGTELIFASDEPGGHGGMDLYVTHYKSGNWSRPVNLGPDVNSEGNEVFPFLQNNTLFYSTDGSSYDQGIDICRVSRTSEVWGNLVLLDTSINSSADDFGFSSFDNGKLGYFTSNRDKGKDQIFSFSRGYPEPDSCVDFKEIYYCYLLEDYNSLDEDGMPLKFQWDMGDGNTIDGYKVIHCYDTLGVYNAQLNVIDTVFNEVYFAVTEVTVNIKAEDSPYMLAPDTVGLNSNFNVQIDLTHYSETPELVYWKMNSEFAEEGSEVRLSSEGLDSMIVSMVWQIPNGNTYCMNKTVFIKEGFETSFQLTTEIPDEGDEELTEIKTEKDSSEDNGFSVRFLESNTKLDFNDSIFKDVDYEIMERYLQVENIYDYSVGTSKKMDDLYFLYREMKELGFTAEVIEYQIEEVSGAQVDTGTVALFFALSSYDITEYNRYNMEHFVANLSPDTKLSVIGFADITGDKSTNQILSEQRAKVVKNELVKLGFNAENISISGKGGIGEESEDKEDLHVYRKVEISIVN